MASQPIYQFYTELADYEPKIWRRFQVTGNVTMARLGYIVMTMYEMQACHLFCFDIPVAENLHRCTDDCVANKGNSNVIDLFEVKPELATLRIELLDEDEGSEFEGRVLDAAQTKLKNTLKREAEVMCFTYDYGDDWAVFMTLEKIFEDKELPAKELPRVLEGAGYGIIEDCGGAGGLEDIVQAFKTKKGEAYQEYRDWLGRDDLDLSAFDMDDINFRLKKVPRIYSDIYEMGYEPTQRSIDILERKYLKKK